MRKRGLAHLGSRLKLPKVATRRGRAGHLVGRSPNSVCSVGLLWRVATWVYLLGLTGLLVMATTEPVMLSRDSLTMLAIGVVLGVPHGAFDHLVPKWLDVSRQRQGLGLVLPYVLVAAVAVAAEVLAPLPTIGVLVLVSAYHFADGEAESSALRAHRTRDRLDSSIGWATSVAMLAVPALAHPRLVELLSRAVLHTSLPLPGGALRISLLVASVGFVLGVTVMAAREHRWLPALELTLLGLAGLLVAPGAVFAVAFALGHAFRHIVRLADLHGRADVHQGRCATSRRLGHWQGQIVAVMMSGAPLVVVLAAGALAVGVLRLSVVEVSVAGVLALSVPHTVVARSMGNASALRPFRFKARSSSRHLAAKQS